MESGESDLIVPMRLSSPLHVHIKFDISAKLLVNGRDEGDSVLLYLDEICCNPWNPSSQFAAFDFIGYCLYRAGYNDHEIALLLNLTSKHVIDTLNNMIIENSKLDIVSLSLSMWKAKSWEAIVDEVEEYNRALEAAMEESAPKPIPATKESINALKRVKLGDINEVSVSSQICVVCLEELITQPQTKELIASMPCSHLFHEDCIVQWLNTSHVCPLCRFSMPTYANNQ